MMKSKFPFGILIVLLLAACDPGSQRRIQRDAVLEEMENREPKRLTEAQVTAHAFKTGREITAIGQNYLLPRLQQLTQQQGLSPSKAFQNSDVLAFTDSLSRVYRAEIRLLEIGQKLTPPGEREELENQLLEAYQYNQENDLALEDNIQPIGYNFLYTAALVLPANSSADSLSAQEEKKAENLVGIWSILLSRKEVVNAI